MGKTSIEWTDYSWPVVNGCRRVSAGCENCYAERLTATRLSQTPKYKGLAVMKAGPEKVLRRDHRDGSVSLKKVQGPARPRWTGEARLWVPHLDMPLRLKKPSRIFVADMGDLFYEGVPDEVIAAVFGVMAACPQHTFQVLTKRPERAREWFRWVETKASGRRLAGGMAAHAAQILEEYPESVGRLTVWMREALAGSLANWPLPNVWLGVSVEDQATADERIPILLDIPAALRWVSAEPLLEAVALSRWLSPLHTLIGKIPTGARARFREQLAKLEMASALFARDEAPDVEFILGAGIDWCVVGGESGPGARPCALEWIEAVVADCAAARLPVFVKQLGAKVVSTERVDAEGRWAWQAGLKDRKGGDMTAWPLDLCVREFPTAGPSIVPAKSEALAVDGSKTDEITAG